jgi:hypothetical protein
MKKLKSLDATHVKIDSTENDKRKMYNNKAILDLTRRMTMTTFNTENEGFVFNSAQQSLIIFNLVNGKKKNRQTLWKNIRESDQNSKKLDSLFNSN